MNPRVFREYDIRGVAERDLDDATVRAIGIAVGAKAGGTVVVGRDCRTHSPRLFAALSSSWMRGDESRQSRPSTTFRTPLR